MKLSKQARAARNRRDHADDFYEVIPMALSPHYVYRDDTDAYPVNATATEDPQAAARRLAIITLGVLAVLAVIIGFTLAEGLAALQAAMNLPL